MVSDSSVSWSSQHSQHMLSLSSYSCWVNSLPQTSQKCFFLAALMFALFGGCVVKRFSLSVGCVLLSWNA